MNNYYENKHLIKREYWDSFDSKRKKPLNQVELLGLESILSDFVEEFEVHSFGENCIKIEDYTRFNDDYVDILDGFYDTYLFDYYAVNELWCTENGCVMLDCFRTGGDPESIEYDSRVLFRLN